MAQVLQTELLIIHVQHAMVQVRLPGYPILSLDRYKPPAPAHPVTDREKLSRKNVRNVMGKELSGIMK